MTPRLLRALAAGAVVAAILAMVAPVGHAVDRDASRPHAARQVAPVRVTAHVTRTPTGTDLTTTVTVVNRGRRTAPASRLRVSRLDLEYTQLLDRVPVPALAPGQRVRLTRTVRVPTTSLPGRFKVLVCPTSNTFGRRCVRTPRHLWLAPVRLRVSTSAIDFGEVNLGESAQRSFVVANRGQLRAVDVSALPLGRDHEGRDFDQFDVPYPACPDLDPGQTCTVTLTYTPTREGPVQAELLVGSSSATFGETPRDLFLPLTGTALAPAGR